MLLNKNTDNVFSCFTHLGDISVEIFLRDYWQKKPLLIRQAFKNFESPISADELAGLSLEDDIVSRLIVENSKGADSKNSSWTVEHGPIDEDRFSELPEKQWTLMVQHADSLDPDINRLLNAFRFIPNWRLDDIMVSYAADQGGVGPHFDYFDVFLLQAQGQRRWRTGQHCDSKSDLVPDQVMKVLSSFETNEDWIVEPGDLLYIPAQTAHWGEAIGECMTYSIGFRAPSDEELILDYSQNIVAPLSEDDRYRDENCHPQEHQGEITEAVIDNFQKKLDRLLSNKHALASWIAKYSTQLPNSVCNDSDENRNSNFPSEVISAYEAATIEDFLSDAPLKVAPFNRCVFIPPNIVNRPDPNGMIDKKSTITECYINGTAYTVTIQLAKTLSSYSNFSMSSLSHEEHEHVKLIINDQYIMLDDKHV